jgi:rare lipoprotein A
MRNHRRTALKYLTIVISVAGSIVGSAPVEANIWQARKDGAPQSYPSETPTVYRQVGLASWYGRHWRGRPTASGALFDDRQLTAAHRHLPLRTKARVTNLENGRSVEVTVNDRGPYVKGRVIDLSKRAAEALAMTEQGVAWVRIDVLPAATTAEAAGATSEAPLPFTP